MGPVRNPVLYLTQGAPVFPGSSRLGIEPKTLGGILTQHDRGTSAPTTGRQRGRSSEAKRECAEGPVEGEKGVIRPAPRPTLAPLRSWLSQEV